MAEQAMLSRPTPTSPLRGLMETHRTADLRTADLGAPDLRSANLRTVDLKTQGEIEAAVCEGLRRFELDYMGRGPKDIRAHLLGDLLVVRLTGVLTAAEYHLAQSFPADKGRDLLKQVRAQLIGTARPILERMIQASTGVELLSLHQDISTVTGEEIIVFTLAEFPDCRETKRRQHSGQTW